MNRTKAKKSLALIVAAVAAAAVIYFGNRAAGQVASRREDNRRLVAFAGALLTQHESSIRELNEDLEAVASKNVRRGYASFVTRSAARISKNGSDINALAELPAGTEPARRLKSALIRYASKAQSVEYTMRYCADSAMFSYGAPASDTCYSVSRELIFRDIARLGAEVRANMRYLSARNGWLSVYRMPPAKRRAVKQAGVNVIFILVDTLRADAMDATDAEGKPVAPVMARLAREGVVYTEAVSAAPGTYTAVSSIFTGCDPLESNAARESKWNYKSSLIDKFKKAGYDTIGFSANSLISEENNFNYGFNIFRDRFWPPAVVIMNEVETRLIAERPSNPFFLYVHLIDPHAPYFSQDDVRNIAMNGRPEGYEMNPAHIRDAAAKKGPQWQRDILPGNVAYLRSLYNKEAAYADKWIGNLLDYLKAKGFLDNTLVVVTADHGEQFYEHGDMEHAKYLWRELTHVPLILNGKLPPGLSPGRAVSEPHSTMEILPSILKWRGVELEGTPARRATLFGATPGKPAAPVFSESPCCKLDEPGKNSEIISLIEGNYKIIVEPAARKALLFDMAADPAEKNDLSLATPGRAAAMTKRAVAVMEESIRARTRAGATPKPSTRLQKQLKSLGYIK